jgi:hypothetical protein
MAGDADGVRALRESVGPVVQQGNASLPFHGLECPFQQMSCFNFLNFDFPASHRRVTRLKVRKDGNFWGRVNSPDLKAGGPCSWRRRGTPQPIAAANIAGETRFHASTSKSENGTQPYFFGLFRLAPLRSLSPDLSGKTQMPNLISRSSCGMCAKE